MHSMPRRAHFRDALHFGVAIASEIAAPALRLVARTVSRGAPTAPDAWRRALIVGHGHIGDVLCQTVSLESLHDGLPECSFDYLTTPLAAEVLAGNPNVGEVLPWNHAPRPDAVDETALSRLRERRYDAVICTNVVRHHEALRLALALGAPNRVAFIHRGLSGLVTLPVALTRPATPPEQSRAMAHAITGRADRSELRPRMYPTAADAAAASSEWQRLDLGDVEPVIACAITTRQTIGRVSESFFANVLAELQRIAPRARIVLCGSRDDRANLHTVARALPRPVAVSGGELNLLAFQSFLSRCSAFFGMDSGPRHIANSAGIPVVFVRNLAVRAAEAGAYCPTEIDVAPAGDFLTPREIEGVLASLDVRAIAETIVARATRR